MDIHKNARLTPHSRAELVRRVLVERQSKTKVAADFGVCVKTITNGSRASRQTVSTVFWIAPRVPNARLARLKHVPSPVLRR